MFDPQKLLGSMVGDALGGAFGGKRKNKHKHKSAFRTGDIAGKAALGLGALGVAIAAYEHFQQKNRAPAPTGHPGYAPPPAYSPPVAAMPAPPMPGPVVAPPPPPPAFSFDRLDAREAEAVLLVQTMIAAAEADGLVDAGERHRILARADEAGLDPSTRVFLEAQLAKPPTVDEIAARTRPDQVDEVYAAALLAIQVDSEGERRFLANLARALGLDETRRQAIHDALSGALPAGT